MTLYKIWFDKIGVCSECEKEDLILDLPEYGPGYPDLDSIELEKYGKNYNTVIVAKILEEDE